MNLVKVCVFKTSTKEEYQYLNADHVVRIYESEGKAMIDTTSVKEIVAEHTVDELLKKFNKSATHKKPKKAQWTFGVRKKRK